MICRKFDTGQNDGRDVVHEIIVLIKSLLLSDKLN